MSNVVGCKSAKHDSLSLHASHHMRQTFILPRSCEITLLTFN